MKKLLLILLLLIAVLTAQAETHYYKVVVFNVKPTGYNWSGWKESNVEITIDYLTRHIEIGSTIPQIINYGELSIKRDSAYILYYGSAKDRNYTPIGIFFQIFNYGTFYLTVEYSDCTYSYSLIELDTD